MIPNDFLPIANHLWQSTMFAGVAAVLTPVPEEQPGACTLLSVAGGFG